jgi:hypothetical protein
MRLAKGIAIILSAVVFLSGCNTYRLVPSHGGGKRFDEEARAVSAAIRNAVAQVDVTGMAGHKVNVAIVTIAQNGGGSVTLPGFNSVTGGYNSSDLNYGNQAYILNKQDSWNFNLGYTPNVTGFPTVFGTDQDVTYLGATVEMKLRVNGAVVATTEPEYVLYVLIDVLGTNRSKEDHLITWKDTLTASCELTYYAMDVKTNKILFDAKRAAAEACYQEYSVFGFAGYKAERSQYKIAPTPMPTDVNDTAIDFYETQFKPDMSELPAQSSAAPQKEVALAKKFQEAESYVQAGNWQAAERLRVEISEVNPNYMGLDSLNSMINNAKAAAQKESKESSDKTQEPQPAEKH